MSPNNATQVINPSIKMDAMALEKVLSFLGGVAQETF
jgi:hypothetical protein